MVATRMRDTAFSVCWDHALGTMVKIESERQPHSQDNAARAAVLLAGGVASFKHVFPPSPCNALSPHFPFLFDGDRRTLRSSTSFRRWKG